MVEDGLQAILATLFISSRLPSLSLSVSASTHHSYQSSFQSCGKITELLRFYVSVTLVQSL